MLIPQILPDEFVVGYRTRLRILNGFPDNDTLIRALLPKTRVPNTGEEGRSAIAAIASALGTDCTELVCRHSMIPFIRAIAQLASQQAHGDPTGNQRLVRFGMREIRGAAHSCPCCVAEDLDFWGIPYWRRSHQIPGVDWCPKHGCSLLAAPREHFDDLPAAPASPNAAGRLIEVCKHPVLSRYGEIAQGLMDMKQPMPCSDVSRVLGTAARAGGLRVSPTGRKPLLSDLARERLPMHWLTSHFPQVAHKTPLEYVSTVDGVCEPRNAVYTTGAYVLAAALLYDSADDALQALVHAQEVPSPRPTVSRSKLTQDRRRFRQLTDAFIQSNGNHAMAAKLLTAEPKNISQKLNDIGLPSLANVNPEIRGALFAFLQGQPLDQACMDAGLDIAAVANILRAACTPLYSALVAMDGKGTSSKPSIH